MFIRTYAMAATTHLVSWFVFRSLTVQDDSCCDTGPNQCSILAAACMCRYGHLYISLGCCPPTVWLDSHTADINTLCTVTHHTVPCFVLPLITLHMSIMHHTEPQCQQEHKGTAAKSIEHNHITMCSRLAIGTANAREKRCFVQCMDSFCCRKCFP